MSVPTAPRNAVFTYNGTQTQQTNEATVEWSKPSSFGDGTFDRYEIRYFLLSEGKDGPNAVTYPFKPSGGDQGPYGRAVDFPFTGDWRLQVRAVTNHGAGAWAQKDIHVFFDAGLDD